MKKIALILVVLASGLASAQGVQQQQNLQPQINVSGEGKVKVMPDQATIIIGVDNVGANAAEVKKKNDEAIDAIIKYLKGIKLPEADYQTQRVNLNRTYDYDKKKFSFTASQTIQINLKDLTKYDALMMGVVDAGANNIEGIQFKTSKQAQYESEARVKAVQQARGKANDYAGALGVKAGKAIVVTDNSQTYYPVMRGAMYKEMTMADMPKETLAIGEIEITANVNIIFSLD
jgi:uncharacterized protein YggE